MCNTTEALLPCQSIYADDIPLCYYRDLWNRRSIPGEWRLCMDWIERARCMVAYHPEAVDFIRRASDYFPVDMAHIHLLLRLWVEADNMDAVILPMLHELNAGLLDEEGIIDTNRGASLRPTAFASFSDANTEEIVYECFWHLNWGDSQALSVVMSVNGDGVFQVQARGEASVSEHRIGYPPSENALKDALIAVYVAEQTAD